MFPPDSNISQLPGTTQCPWLAFINLHVLVLACVLSL
jgi:hypothetical protein